MNKNSFLWLSGLLFIFFYSCNLSDFETNRLIEPTDLKPLIYRPVSYATYPVKDFATILETGNSIVTQARIDFIPFPLPYDLKGMSFSSQAMDTMVIIIKTVNETPMKLQYKLTYPGTTMDSGILQSAKLNSNGDVLEAAKDSIEYGLSAAEVKILGTAPVMDLYISLFQPDTGGVIANALKNSQVSFKIGVRVPVNLVKIQ